MRTIRVTGKGNMKLHPDMMRVTVTLTKVHKEYAEALKHASEDVETLKDLLAGFGFGREELKTLSFNVDAEYESYREDNEYRQRLTGYRYRHTVKVDFDSDNERLGKVLYALARSELEPEFNISYTVRDPEAAKNVLLAKAVADSKEKAVVLAEAAGPILKEIQSVDYSFGAPDLEVRPAGRSFALSKNMAVESAAGYDLNLEPDDVSISDTVTVVWEIG